MLTDGVKKLYSTFWWTPQCTLPQKKREKIMPRIKAKSLAHTLHLDQYD
jgi:hypothetical protein